MQFAELFLITVITTVLGTILFYRHPQDQLLLVLGVSFFGLPEMGSNLAVKVRYTLGSRKC